VSLALALGALAAAFLRLLAPALPQPFLPALAPAAELAASFRRHAGPV
jgi:hypothetical protein